MARGEMKLERRTQNAELRKREARIFLHSAFCVLRSAFIFVLFTTCTSQSDTYESLEFWGLGREGEVVTALLPQFEKENPDIKVTVQQIPWTAAHEKLLTAYVGESTPDVAQMGNTWIPEFVAVRALADLRPFTG